MADILVRNESSIVMFTPKSNEGRTWVDENLNLESWQWLGQSFAVEWRYAPDIVQGMMEDGLEVIPESHDITDEDKEWLAELGISYPSSNKIATEPQINLRPETNPNTPNIPGAPVPSLFLKGQKTSGGRNNVEEALALEDNQQSDTKDNNQQSDTKERHTILPELPNSMLHMAKMARGGWKRISMSTVQSDDNRFTITIIDPTRRGKWFLLKDLETGESYEERTMTGAKKKALSIRGDSTIEVDLYRDEDNPMMINPLQ